MADRLLEALLAIARDSFRSAFDPAPSAELVNPVDHPSASAFLEALSEDPELAVLCGSGEDGAFAMASTGEGWRIPPSLVADSLIRSAAREAIGRAEDTPDMDLFLATVEGHLRRFRRLLSGESGEALVLIAFDGLSIAEGLRIETPWGLLRAAHPTDLASSPIGLGRPSVILESRIPLGLHLGEPDDSDSMDIFDQDSLITVDNDTTLIALAVLLALYDGPGSPVADRVWRTAVIPGQAGSAYSGAPSVK